MMTTVTSDDVVMTVTCDEPEGKVEREIRLAPLTIENLGFLWENLRQFPTLFNEELSDFEDFANAFMHQVGNDIQPHGIIWMVDDVGIVFITAIQPGIQAHCHCSFWDRRLKGREPILREMVRYAFEEFGFHRLNAEVPHYATPIHYFVKSAGFKKEGRLREAALYRDKWWDIDLYGVLETEV